MSITPGTVWWINWNWLLYVLLDRRTMSEVAELTPARWSAARR